MFNQLKTKYLSNYFLKELFAFKELFLEYIGRESAKHTQTAKRKTVLKRDVDAAIDSVPHLCFLDGALE